MPVSCYRDAISIHRTVCWPTQTSFSKKSAGSSTWNDSWMKPVPACVRFDRFETINNLFSSLLVKACMINPIGHILFSPTWGYNPLCKFFLHETTGCCGSKKISCCWYTRGLKRYNNRGMAAIICSEHWHHPWTRHCQNHLFPKYASANGML